MKVLSLFSGIGAFEKALTNLGVDYELVGFSEIDKWAIQSYCAIHDVGESLNLGDVSKIDEDDLPVADLITYGFPCQDISVAGKGKGISEDTRSGLLYEAERIIDHVKPKYAIAENVKNLVSKRYKEDFDDLLERLDGYGYNNYWKVLNAKDFGIPQNRERVFIVSIRKDVDDGSFKFPKKQGTPHFTEIVREDVSEKYYLVDKMLETIENTKFRSNKNYVEETFKLICGEMEGEHIMDYRYDEGLRIRRTPVVPTLTTRGRQSISGVPILYLDGKLRFITPLEAWIAMGFDANDYHTCSKFSTESQMYKQAGNSIVVDVLEGIFKQLL